MKYVHFIKSKGVYWVRVPVPVECRAIIGKSELIHSLGTANKREAERLAREWIAKFLADIEAAARFRCTMLINPPSLPCG